MYIPRILESTVARLLASFKAVYLGGPRQVGKTTLLLHLARTKRVAYATLDDIRERELARRDPDLFLDRLGTPAFIDEVQYAPELFPALKRRLDQSPRKGQYWLSGSQQFSLLANIQESLAGRVGIVHLLGFSSAELARTAIARAPFAPSPHPPHAASAPGSLARRIFRGSFPALWERTAPPLEAFYQSYLQTYIDRDLRALFGIAKISEFHAFLELCAARTGQILNVSELARDAAISVHAAREWIGILERTMQIFLLRPYARNISKRIIKAPKLYMLDTGFAAFLTRWQSPETLMAGAAAGAFFETHVVSELAKSYLFRGLQPPLYYFRDKIGHEVDVLIERHQTLFPIEIKRAARISVADVKSIEYLRTRGVRMGRGAVISLSREPYPLTRDIDVIPASAVQ
jgi:predicted AAA+ superfamily ATPase